MNLIAGLIFGLFVGALMRAPGAEFVLAANAVNVSVMAALWLGNSFAPAQLTRDMWLETGAALVTFVMVALVFQYSPLWLYAAFAFQAGWSASHIGHRLGAISQNWFAGFAAMANLGFIAALYWVWNYT